MSWLLINRSAVSDSAAPLLTSMKPIMASLTTVISPSPVGRPNTATTGVILPSATPPPQADQLLQHSPATTHMCRFLNHHGALLLLIAAILLLFTSVAVKCYNLMIRIRKLESAVGNKDETFVALTRTNAAQSSRIHVLEMRPDEEAQMITLRTQNSALHTENLALRKENSEFRNDRQDIETLVQAHQDYLNKIGEGEDEIRALKDEIEKLKLHNDDLNTEHGLALTALNSIREEEAQQSELQIAIIRSDCELAISESDRAHDEENRMRNSEYDELEMDRDHQFARVQSLQEGEGELRKALSEAQRQLQAFQAKSTNDSDEAITTSGSLTFQRSIETHQNIVLGKPSSVTSLEAPLEDQTCATDSIPAIVDTLKNVDRKRMGENEANVRLVESEGEADQQRDSSVSSPPLSLVLSDKPFIGQTEYPLDLVHDRSQLTEQDSKV